MRTDIIGLGDLHRRPSRRRLDIEMAFRNQNSYLIKHFLLLISKTVMVFYRSLKKMIVVFIVLIRDITIFPLMLWNMPALKWLFSVGGLRYWIKLIVTNICSTDTDFSGFL